MGATSLFDASTILAIGLVGFIVLFWYGKNVARAFRPLSRMLEAADAHAIVYSAEVKNAAITRASKISIDPKMIKIAQTNLRAIHSFELEAEDIPASE